VTVNATANVNSRGQRPTAPGLGQPKTVSATGKRKNGDGKRLGCLSEHEAKASEGQQQSEPRQREIKSVGS
jgi:hypothetical protein